MKPFPLCLVVLLILVAGAGADVTVTGGGGLISIYVHNLDLLRERHGKLEAEIKIGVSGKAQSIDLKPEWQGPAILIEGTLPSSVSVIIRADGKIADKFDGQVEPTDPTPGIALTQEIAFVESGSGISAKLPPIRQPDLNALPPLALGEARRVVDWNKVEALVKSDTNYPSIGSNNLCAISRQTAHPDDPKRRSIYVPLKSIVYTDSKGASPKNVNYLAEIPLDPKWLEGSGDKDILLSASDVKIHATDRRWPADDPAGPLITGHGKGGLGQAGHSMTVDDNGNIYYSNITKNYLVRFNVHTASFEAPPIDLLEAMNRHLPSKEEMPQGLRNGRQHFDPNMVCGASGGKIFIQPFRYALYFDVFYNGVFSIPADHWDDAEKFRTEMRMLAHSWPGSDVSLYNYWPEENRNAGEIIPGVIHDGSYYFSSYTSQMPAGPWRIELNDDGSSRRVVPATAEEVEMAMKAEAPQLPIRSTLYWWDYGMLSGSRKELSTALYGTAADDKPFPDGTLTIYYDAISAMRTQPERFAGLLASMSGPSSAPSYMLAGVPGEPGMLMGISESGYYLALYDVSKAQSTGIVTKSYLQRDLGKDRDTLLPVKAGLGPYGQLWWQKDRDLYLVLTGYTGVASMLYRQGDGTLERFNCDRRLPPSRSLDGGPLGTFLRERFPVLGIDNRVYFSGENTLDRGGNAFSTGLGVFTPTLLESIGRVSWMSRSRETTGFMVTRVIHQAGEPPLQQFLIAGDMPNPAYVSMLPEADRPKNQDGQMYFYQMRPGEEPSSVMGISLPTSEKDGTRYSRLHRQVLSRDRRYLVSLQQDGRLLCFDLNTWQYTDGYAIDENALWYSYLPSTCFIQSPDDRTFLCLQKPESKIAVFYELQVSSAGKLSLKPHLNLKAGKAAQFDGPNRGTFAFTPDRSGDGSCDLCIAPNARPGGTHMWVIPDFISPRK